MKLQKHELKEFLEEKQLLYNNLNFIEHDPISIPHQFKLKEDIEIAGFLAATIAWGQRKTIINNANKLVKLMGNNPYDFVMHAKEKDYKKLDNFVHRTFNSIDAVFFLKSLKNIYKHHGGLEHVFRSSDKEQNPTASAINHFRQVFFSIAHPARTKKHVSNPADNSSAKRLCMYLRWMIRKDKQEVDFGIWNQNNNIFFPSPLENVPELRMRLIPSHLMCPLDIHSGNVARKLGLLKRTQNDWKAVVELTTSLQKLDPIDPVKYDFALFGLGMNEKF